MSQKNSKQSLKDWINGRSFNDGDRAMAEHFLRGALYFHSFEMRVELQAYKKKWKRLRKEFEFLDKKNPTE